MKHEKKSPQKYIGTLIVDHSATAVKPLTASEIHASLL